MFPFAFQEGKYKGGSVALQNSACLAMCKDPKYHE